MKTIQIDIRPNVEKIYGVTPEGYNTWIYPIREQESVGLSLYLDGLGMSHHLLQCRDPEDYEILMNTAATEEQLEGIVQDWYAEHTVEEHNPAFERCYDYVFGHERRYRLVALSEVLKDVLSLEKGWEIIRGVWTDGEFVSVNMETWGTLLRVSGHKMMYEEERAVWDALPEEFTVYRGGTGKRYAGLSWTLNRRIAEFFAMRFAGVRGETWLFEKRVKKADAIAYLNGRKEEEIILKYEARGMQGAKRLDLTEAIASRSK